MGKKQQDDIKDVGGFVGGHLKDGRRKSGTVLCRSMLTLDMDYGTAGVVDELEMLFGYKMCIYSTHKHTTDEPRLRLIIPLSREIGEEEYPAVGRMVAKEIGIDMFGDTTYQPQRLMYWPSVSMNGEFVFKKLKGDVLNLDDYLPCMMTGVIFPHIPHLPDSPVLLRKMPRRRQTRWRRQGLWEHSVGPMVSGMPLINF